MAIQETIQVNVQSNLAEEEKLAKSINAQLRAAANVRMSAPSSAKMAAANPDGTASNTNLSRGIAGQTGASGRDFAAQAQGLGGLVHVYATFAANIFAVSAAFTALSKAADTTNLIKGLDQLGAASGRGLGGLAKQMAMASDGALSLRDAMSSVALASSAGMTNANIMRMTEVAKKASQALGRDMADSMDRLTKGIAKTQPELLDELGIMARVIPSQEAYARQVGKTVSSLTDLEKKQAFANAVLEEGEKKFAAIKIDANPYSQLSASLINAMQSALEFINKGLSPIAGFLASSPTALTAALAVLGSVLLKQALPALGQFKEGMQKSADLATDLANKRSLAANAARKAEFTALKQSLDNEAEIRTAAIDKAEASARKIAAASSFKPSKGVQTILSKDVRDISETDLAKIEKVASTQASSGREALAQSYRNLAIAIKESQAAELNYDKQVAEGTKRLQERQSIFTAAGRTQALADRANLAATTRNIASQAAETASISGFGAAWQETKQKVAAAMKGPQEKIIPLEIDKVTGEVTKSEKIIVPAMGRIRASWTLFSAGVSAAGSAISSFLSFAQPWLQIIGLAVTAFGFLSDAISTNSKSAAETQTAFDQLGESTKTVINTFERLQTLDPLERLSTQNISAKSTAVTEVAASIENAFNKITKQAEDANWFDILWDTAKADVGLGLLKQSSTELANATVESLRLAKGTEAGTKAAEDLAKALNIDPTDKEALKSALRDSPEKFFELGPQVVQILKTLGVELTKSSMAAQNFDAAVATASKTFDELLISMLPTDLTARIGFQFIDMGKTIGDALAKPEQAMQKLADIAKDNQKLRLFSPEFAVEIAKASPMIQQTSERLAKYQQGIKDQQAEIDKLLKERAKLTAPTVAKDKFSIDKNTAALQQAGAGISTLQTLSKPLEESLAPFIAKFRDEEIKAFARGAELVQASIGDGFAKAAVTISKAYAEGLGGTIGGLQERARLDKINIDIQLRQIKASQSLAEITDKLALVTEERLIFDREQSVLNKIDAVGGPTDTQAKEYRFVLSDKAGLELAKELAGKINLSQISQLLKGTADAKLLNGRTVEEGKAAAKFLLPGAQRKESANAVAAGLAAQKQAIDIGLDFQKMQQIAAIEKDRLATEESGLTVEKATIDIRAKNALYLDSELLALKKQNEEAIAKNKNAQENLSIQLEIDKANKSLEAARIEMSRKQKPEASNKSYEAEQNALSALAELEAKQANAKKRQDDDAEKRLLGYGQDGIAAEKARFDLAIANSKAIEADRAAAAQAELTIADEKLARLTAAGALEQSEIAVLTTKSNINKELERSSAAQYATAIAYVQQQALLSAQKAQEPAGSTAAKNIQDQIDLNQTLYSDAINREQQLTAEKIKTLTVQGQINVLLAKQAEQMTIANNLTQSLTTVFGEMGTNIGKSVESIVQFGQTQEKYDEARAELMKDEAGNKNKIKALDEKNTRDQLHGITSIAAASKKMFGEKTLAARLFSGLEKASAAMSMALEAQKLASYVAGMAAKIGVDIPGIYASFMAQLGPFGPAAAAVAIAAFLGGFGRGGGGGGGGGGGHASYTGPSAEDQKKIQGTGMQYQGNTLVDTGHGVLGASDQLSETLTKAQTLLAENSVKALEIDKSMLNAINDLVDSISNVVTVVAQNGDISKGINLGDLPSGTSMGGGLLGLGGIGDLFKGLPLIGGAIGNFFNNVFGGGISASSEITAAGLKFSGSIYDLARNAEGAFARFRDVLTHFHEDGGWFSSDSDWTEMRTELFAVNAEIRNAVGMMFMNIENIARTVGKKAGVANGALDSALRSVKITDRLDLKGLSIEDQNKLLQSVTSKALTQVFEQVLPQFKKFQKAGEDLAATVFRVIDAQEKVNLSLDLVGSKLTNNLGYEFTEKLVAAAGGLKNFVDQATFFADHFNTAAENNAVAQQQLTKGMKALGLSSVTTRDQFKYLVKDLVDDFTPANAALYQQLMNLAPLFDQVASAAEKAAATTYDLETSLLSAQGYSSEVQDRNRQKTLNAMQSESDKVIQHQIYAQEDLNKTQSLNVELLNAQGKSYDALLITREKEIDALSLIDQIIKKKTYAEQDAAKTRSLDIELLNAQGKTYDALLIARAQELKALSDSDAAIKRKVYAEQDAAKTQGLQVQLLNLQGKAEEALTSTRERELLALSTSDQVIQKKIYALQDEAAAISKLNTIRSSEIAIYTLLGKTSEALALQREQDLESTADYLKASKRYQFALENEKVLKDKISAAYTKQKDALKSTITGLESSISSLKDFKSSLLTSANSVLTPQQIYQNNKNTFDALATASSATITSTSTEADIKARDDALSRLPAAASALLDSSRTMFASSDRYTADFSYVNSILTGTVGALETQKSVAENQLSALEDSVSFLNLIETNTETTTQLLAQLVALTPATEAARKAAAESGSIAAGGAGFKPPDIIGISDVVAAVTASTTAATTASNTLIKTFDIVGGGTITAIKTASDKEVTISTLIANYDSLTNTILKQLVEIVSANRTIAVTVNPIIEFNPTINVAAPSVTVNNSGSKSIWDKVGDWLGFAEGGLAPAGINLVGEKGPELVDFKTPGRVYSNKASNDLFNSKQLVEEIRSLRQEVNRLRNDQKEQTGHLITATYDANAQNAEQVTAGTEDALQAQNWKARSQIKFA